MPDQRFDHVRRMLAVAVDEQHRAAAGMFEAGDEGRLLAEIARQRDHLNVDARGRQIAGDGERAVATAVVDINQFAGERTLGLQPLRHLDQPRVQTFERGRFVIERHHDREAGAGRRYLGIGSTHRFVPSRHLITASNHHVPGPQSIA